MKVLDMIINNGGATVKDNKKVNYDNGYQVCTNKNSEMIFNNVYDCEQYIKDNGLKDYGLWFDSGKCYLDTSSVWIESKSEAIKIGKENNQRSIYDWKASKSLAIEL